VLSNHPNVYGDWSTLSSLMANGDISPMKAIQQRSLSLMTCLVTSFQFSTSTTDWSH
jgi:hypothetical protein